MKQKEVLPFARKPSATNEFETIKLLAQAIYQLTILQAQLWVTVDPEPLISLEQFAANTWQLIDARTEERICNTALELANDRGIWLKKVSIRCTDCADFEVYKYPISLITEAARRHGR